MIPEFFTGKYILRLSTVRIGLAEKSPLVIPCGSKIAPVSMSRDASPSPTCSSCWCSACEPAAGAVCVVPLTSSPLSSSAFALSLCVIGSLIQFSSTSSGAISGSTSVA